MKLDAFVYSVWPCWRKASKIRQTPRLFEHEFGFGKKVEIVLGLHSLCIPREGGGGGGGGGGFSSQSLAFEKSFNLLDGCVQDVYQRGGRIFWAELIIF